MLHASKPSINDMGTEMFRTLIFQHQKLQDKIIGGACELIASDRNAETLDQTTFRRSIGMFHDLSAYTKVFEPRMLDLSQEFIKSWAERACSEKTLADYVRSCNQFVAKETERCNLFGLDSTTKRALTTMLEFHLIERQESFLGKYLCRMSTVYLYLGLHFQSLRGPRRRATQSERHRRFEEPLLPAASSCSWFQASTCL